MMVELSVGYAKDELEPVMKWWTPRGVVLQEEWIRPDRYGNEFVILSTTEENYVRFSRGFEVSTANRWGAWINRRTLRLMLEDDLVVGRKKKKWILEGESSFEATSEFMNHTEVINKEDIRGWLTFIRALDRSRAAG